MKFEPLHFSDRLRVINEEGDVGVVTLWTGVDQVLSKFQEWGIDLSPETSRIAVLGNLYGNGLPHLLRNLLYNPQIRRLLILGQDLSKSGDQLDRFFDCGVKEETHLGAPAYLIRGTQRYLDTGVHPDDFDPTPSVLMTGTLGDPATMHDVRFYFSSLVPASKVVAERKDVPLPVVEVERFPSLLQGHTVIRRSPMEAWKELVYRLVRFGQPADVKKGRRMELSNVKVVVEHPTEDLDQVLLDLGFEPEAFRQYQADFVDGRLPEGVSYTYGNRMRGHFNFTDFLHRAERLLKEDLRTRKAFWSLWDSGFDGDDVSPCMVSLFFRVLDDRLTLTATFRTHNAMTAWPRNIWGLIHLLRLLAYRTGIAIGPLTVISHSISVDADPLILEQAKQVAKQRKSDDERNPETGKRELRADPCGAFMVEVDQEAKEIVALHTFGGVTLAEYRGKTAASVRRDLSRDMAVSLISHALYLGEQLSLAEQKLKGL